MARLRGRAHRGGDAGENTDRKPSVPAATHANNLQNALTSGATALVPIAIGIAIFRYRLYDIDVVINKTLVYGSLAVFITGVYVAIVVGIGSLAQRGARPSLALSIAASGGGRDRFPTGAGMGPTPGQPAGLRSAGHALRGPGGFRGAHGRGLRGRGPAAADGQDPGRGHRGHPGGCLAEERGGVPRWRCLARRCAAASAGLRHRCRCAGLPGADRILPVRYQGEVLGALSVSKRPGEALTPTEGRLLADLAGQVGLVLKNAGLREQLLARLEEIRASRQRLVAAQDAERRRIERNIHDGAQQQLVALAIKLSITESLIGSDTDGERELLAELRQDAVGAVEDLRDLARGIYPPLLASAGLAAALEAQARKAPVPTSVTANGVGRYPQDVEAAVYFCVLEALQNVAKYAGATRAEVRLAASGHSLEFTVTDDGAGFDPGSKAYGTGLQGMADRLHAHGGSLTVRSAPGAGTTIGAAPGTRGGRVSTAAARWLAGGLLGLTIAALAVSAGFGVAAHEWRDAFAFAPVLLAFAGVGAFVASHRPGNAIGWLFGAEGLWGGLGVAGLAYAGVRGAIRRPTCGRELGGLGGGFRGRGLLPAVPRAASLPGRAAAFAPLAAGRLADPGRERAAAGRHRDLGRGLYASRTGGGRPGPADTAPGRRPVAGRP